MKKFTDGITSLVSSIANRRKASASNIITADKIPDSELRAAYRIGIVSKIIRLKAGYALNDTLQFHTISDKDFYNNVLAKHVKRAAKFQLGFGRGVIVIAEHGADLSKVAKDVPEKYTLQVFSGDIVTHGQVDLNLTSRRYRKPISYQIYGKTIHHSRVVDFTYYEPAEVDAPEYRYGGISETELCYNQILNLMVIEEAGSTIIEKNSTPFFKVKDFKSLLASKKESDLLEYVSRLEDLRSIYGMGVMDAEDTIEVVNQTLADYDKVVAASDRKLAMVSGIPASLLAGENPKGLGSTGEQERTAFMDTIENYQSDYLEEPIADLSKKLGRAIPVFKDNQGSTPESRIDYETKAITNAVNLSNIGEDYQTYLEEKNIIQKDEISAFFSELAEGLDDEPQVI